MIREDVLPKLSLDKQNFHRMLDYVDGDIHNYRLPTDCISCSHGFINILFVIVVFNNAL